jgi:hypothetical protein
MPSRLVRRVPVAVAGLAVFAIGGSVVLAAIPNGNGGVYACYSKTTGALRVIDYPSVRCTSGEKMLALASAGTTVTKHVDGSVKVFEPANGGRQWLARFEVRTTSDVVQFGYMHLYGIGGNVAGQIHEFSVYRVDYYSTSTGAKGATLWMEECFISPVMPCVDDHGTYQISDGGTTDTFLANLGWTVESGNISIYSTSGQNVQ